MPKDEDRAQALAEHLGVDVEEIEASSYGDKILRVNPHIVRDGTSPTEARKRVELIREAFARVLPVVPGFKGHGTGDGITTQNLLSHHHLNKQAKRANEGRRKDIEQRTRNLPKYRFAGEDDFRRPTIEDLKTLALDNNHTVKRALEEIGEIETLVRETEEKRARFLTYDNLTLMFRALCPDLVSVGLQDLVNGLYWLCPDCENYREHFDKHGNHPAHVLTLREAFNGEEVQDRTTPRETEDGEYMVLTDDEADSQWIEQLGQIFDDCYLPEIAPHLRDYFNRERWIEEAQQDGRGHTLSGYDGEEQEAEVDGETFYIYRTN